MTGLEGSLGLCIKAGACCFGFDKSLRMIREGKSSLVIVSDSASERTKKMISDKCEYYGVKKIGIDLENILAKLKIEGNVKIVSINNFNFAKLIEKGLKEKHKLI